MSTMKKLAKSGMFGLAGLAATNKGSTNKIARKGGLGLVGMLLAKKKRAAEKAGATPGRPMVDEDRGGRGAPIMGNRRASDMGEDENTQQFKKGGKISAAQAVHKHERAKHKGQPLTKMAKGGSTASKRADGCATKGKTKGRFV
jgi:hypothetical protein